jgi:hypothetical protein
MAWTILLTGDERARAEARIEEITLALAGRALPSPALAGGTAGTALFLGARARAGAGPWAPAEEALEQAIAAVGETALGPSLYSGFSGVAWVADHLAGDDGEDGEDGNEEVDAALLDHVALSPWRGDYDLISGLVGFGVYALERVRRRRAASATALLARIIDRLEELAVETPGSPGATFWTSPELMIPDTARAHPGGYYNLGLAHGVPGVIALLGAAADAGVEAPRARALLERVVTWFLAQREPGDDRSQFAYTVEVPPSSQPRRTRVAWCYGDAGIAAALLWAGQCAGRDDWVATAATIAREAAARPEDRCGVVDAGLCHGAAGLALIYNRLGQATGDADLLEAARRWARRTMDMHQPGVGVGGYQAWMPLVADREAGWIDDPGLLTGAAGIALALHAFVSADEPTWDLFLLTSARPR